MKIWKSTLQGLLEEVVGPVYLLAVAERSTATLGTGSMDTITFSSISRASMNTIARSHYACPVQRYLSSFKPISSENSKRTGLFSKKYAPACGSFLENIETAW